MSSVYDTREGFLLSISSPQLVPKYTVCVNSSYLLVCDPNVVSFYKDVFRFLGRIRYTREIESHSFSGSEFQVEIRSFTSDFPIWGLWQKGLLRREMIGKKIWAGFVRNDFFWDQYSEGTNFEKLPKGNEYPIYVLGNTDRISWTGWGSVVSGKGREKGRYLMNRKISRNISGIREKSFTTRVTNLHEKEGKMVTLM